MLQNRFLAAAVSARVPITLYLIDGIKPQGQIESFDQYGLVLSGSSFTSTPFPRSCRCEISISHSIRQGLNRLPTKQLEPLCTRGER